VEWLGNGRGHAVETSGGLALQVTEWIPSRVVTALEHGSEGESRS